MADHTHGHDHRAHAGHAHGHDGGHGPGLHSHAPKTFDRAFGVGVALNLLIVGLQFGYGLVAHSMALLADGVHNFGDVLGLLFAWAAAWASRRRPSARRTYGWGRSTILASLLNAAILLASTGAIAVEALRRLVTPGAVASGIVMWVAAAAILANGGTALMFMRGRSDDLNIRGAFLHMAGDAAVSAAVLAAAWVITLTGWVRLDPLASLLIVAAIAWSSFGLLRESVNLALDAVPRGLDHAAVEACLAGLPNVHEVHDLHIWGLSTTSIAATAHLVAHGSDVIDVRQAAQALAERFRIEHCTFQVETLSGATLCALRPAEVV